MVFPDRQPVNDTKCPRSYAWLKQYGLTDEEIAEHYFYNPWGDRIIFHCIDPVTGEEYFEGRHHNPSVIPKTLSSGTKPNIFIGDGTSDTVVIVEDAVSAIKVGRHALVMPLFGSHMTPHQMSIITKLDGIDQVIFWLDEDKYALGMQLARRMGLLKPSVAIHTSKDPKWLTDEEIVVQLEDALDALEAV